MDDVQRGERMRELRLGVGMRQRQVGAHFDIDKSAVSEWERGKSAPDRRKLVELDKLYRADGEVLRLYDVETDTATRIDRLEAEINRLQSEQDALRDQVARLGQDAESFRATVNELLATAVDRVAGGVPPSELRADQ